MQEPSNEVDETPTPPTSESTRSGIGGGTRSGIGGGTSGIGGGSRPAQVRPSRIGGSEIPSELTQGQYQSKIARPASQIRTNNTS